MTTLTRPCSLKVSLLAAAWLTVCLSARANAQDTPPAAPADPNATTLTFFRNTEIGGLVDGYYDYYSTKHDGLFRNFDTKHNSFALSMAEVWIARTPTADARAGYKVRLNFGPATTNFIHASEPGGTNVFQNIEEAYGSYLVPTGKGLQIDFGKFVTAMGNEVIESKDNWNYSRSLLFALAIPYYHVGARVSYSPSDKLTLQAHLVNGWNDAVDNNTGKSIGGSVTFKPTGALTIIENYMGGPEQTNSSDWRNMSDTVVAYTVNKEVSLAANYDHGHDTLAGSGVMWHGIAGYLKYQANGWAAITPRLEWYNDRDGFTTGTPQALKEATVTLELKASDSFMWRVEYRGDFSDVRTFTDGSGAAAKTQHSLGFGFLYQFSSKS